MYIPIHFTMKINIKVTFLHIRPITTQQYFNPWSPKFRIQGVISKVGYKLTPQGKSIFP